MLNGNSDDPDPVALRGGWMAALARSSAGELTELLRQAPPLPPYTLLRAPETGIVMVRGRAGGGGQPFNLGEMTVSRCSVRSSQGRTGHAYVAGRDTRLAELAAALDAFLQDPGLRRPLQDAVLVPLLARQHARREARASKAAATQVKFFTLSAMRG